MYNDILNGLTKQLKLYFNLPVDSNFVEQSFTGKRIFIQLLSSNKKYRLNRKYTMSYLFNVMYFDENGTYDELNNISEILLDALEMVDVNGVTIRASTYKTSIDDGVLQCRIQYNYVLAERPAEEPGKMASVVSSSSVVRKEK